MGRRHLLLSGGSALIAALALMLFLISDYDGKRLEGYERTAIYPPRKDLLVFDTGKAIPPAGLYPVGKLDESIAAIKGHGGETLDPATLPDGVRKDIASALTELFGTPAEPRINHPDAAGFEPEKLAAGSITYKKRCVDCHGMSGDGRGPTSLWVYPPARDFRQGAFKFVSTGNGLGWPTRADLHRVIRLGIGGNSMLPFAMLTSAETDEVACYTLHLAFRGKVEFELLKAFASDDPPPDVREQAAKELAKAFGQWLGSQSSELKPSGSVIEVRDGGIDAAYDTIVRRGHELFLSDAVGCAKCHENYGRDSKWRYDVWGVTVKPPDLTKGQPRAGSEPLDYFKRIRGGISPSGMPAQNMLRDEEVWNLVAFLKALPDPRHLPPDVREKVYPEHR